MNARESSQKIRTCISVFILLLVGTFYVSAEEFAAASEKKKEILKTFKVSSSDNLAIENRYGDVTITHWNKNEVEIKVVIEARANTDRRVEELLSYVSISIDHSGNTVHGETFMKRFSGTRNNERLRINYYISKPADMKPSIELHYGNVNFPPENNARTALEVKYGNINGGNFSGDLAIECDYGNITLGNLNRAVMELAYCGKIKIGNAKELTIESDYSNGEIKDVGQLNLEIDYGNLNLGTVGIANIEADYSNLNIQRLEKHLYAEYSYGNITVRDVAPTFTNIKADGTYGNLILTLPEDLSFEVVAHDMKYANYDIAKRFNAQTTKNDHDYTSKINNGHSSRKIFFDGNNYGNLIIKAE